MFSEPRGLSGVQRVVACPLLPHSVELRGNKLECAGRYKGIKPGDLRISKCTFCSVPPFFGASKVRPPCLWIPMNMAKRPLDVIIRRLYYVVTDA